MKRTLRSIALMLTALLIFAACNKGPSFETAVGTMITYADPYDPIPVTVRPPTRSANSQYGAIYYRCDLSLVELWEKADAVAWVSIGNWLSETDHGSYYEAAVVKCYKGDLPSSIVLEQAGTSVMTYTDFPLFTYGNEFLVFLQSWDAEALSAAGPYDGSDDLPSWVPGPVAPDVPAVEEEEDVMPIEGGPIYTYPAFTISVISPSLEYPEVSDTTDVPSPEPEPIPEPPYENCYQILSDSAIMDAAVGVDGNVYLLDRYFLVDPYLGFTAPTRRPSDEIAEDIHQVLSRRDAYSHRLFSGGILYRLTDLLDYLENPPPETEEK